MIGSILVSCRLFDNLAILVAKTLEAPNFRIDYMVLLYLSRLSLARSKSPEFS